MELSGELLLQAGGFLLQSIVAGCALTVVIRLAMLPVARHLNATTRYSIWLVTLIAVAVMPMWLLLPQREHRIPSPQRETHARVATPATTPAEQAAGADEATMAIRPVQLPVAFDGAVLLAFLWPAGTALCLLFVAYGYVRVRRLKNDAEPAPPEALANWQRVLNGWPGERTPALLSTARAGSPMAVGYLRPAVLLPDSLLMTVRQKELDAILLHELAHVRRRDDLARLLQAFVRALWFFHPAVHYICRRLDLEREFACDDAVLAAYAFERDYARMLTSLLEQQRAGKVPHPALASGAAFHRKQIVQRVRAILDRTRNRVPAISPVGLVVVLACGAGFAANVVDLPALIELVEAHDGNTFRSEWSSDDRHEFFEVRGEWEIADDGAPLESLPAGTVVRVGEGNWISQTFEFRRTPLGELLVTYKIGSREQRIDAALRRRAEEKLISALRDSGFDVQARAERLFDSGGVPAVIAEADRAGNDHVRGEYLAFLVDNVRARNTDFPRIVSRVARLGDDHRKASLLLQLLEREASPSVAGELAETVRTIQADGEKQRVLSSLFDRPDALTEAQLRRSILRAVDSVQDAVTRAELLIAAARRGPAADAALTEILACAGRIDAADQRARVLDDLAQRETGPELAAKLAGAAGTLQDDVQQANLLVRLAAYPASSAFSEAVRGMRSDPERLRVLHAVVERDGSPGALLAVAELATTISSDPDRAQILSELASRKPADPQLMDAVRRSAARIVSPDEYRSVMRAIEAQ